jgi:hypothetical protein
MTGRSPFLLLLLGVLQAGNPAVAPAQVDSAARSLDSLLGSLRTRQVLRVETRDGASFYGRYLGLHDRRIVLSSPLPPGERGVGLTSLNRLWEKEGTRASAYGRTGAIVGALVFAGLALGLNELNDSADPPSDWSAAAGGAIGGAIFGLVIGNVMGSFHPRWRLLYPT